MNTYEASSNDEFSYYTFSCDILIREQHMEEEQPSKITLAWDVDTKPMDPKIEASANAIDEFLRTGVLPPGTAPVPAGGRRRPSTRRRRTRKSRSGRSRRQPTA